MTDTNNDKETLMSDLENANAKDIKKGLKEFREKHKDKNYNKYVNMYDENKKETFESYWNKNFKEYDDNNDEQMFNLTFRELKQLKQLHDTEMKNRTFTLSETIKEKDKEIEKLNIKINKMITEYYNHNFIQKELNLKISELQAEIKKLKKDFPILD
jgi:predicted RNase H-like nuclease (RuvC/YqgF family)